MQFGPLAQFDINILSPTGSQECELFPKDNFTFIIFTLLIFLNCQQIYEFFHETIQFYIIDFNIEASLKDLIKKVNQNQIDSCLTIFTVIFSCNTIGLLPYTQTLTAQIICTFFLSLQTILTIQLQSFIQLKIAAFNHFIPSGTPLILAPFIISIELISNLSRIISLAVRLFANITSGHALLKILAGFGLITLNLGASQKLLIILPQIIIVVITFLELLIAGLQTYVFLTLILIYISEFE